MRFPTSSPTGALNLYIEFICFCCGTRIQAAQGAVPIEELKPGDKVLTADRGDQPIQWIGSRKVAARARHAPILIRAGALANSRDLRVSPPHRMLVDGWQTQMLFDASKVLLAVKFLVNGETIVQQEGGEVEYFHMLFDQHEIVYAEGAPSESYHPGEVSLDYFDQDIRDEIIDLFPELKTTVSADGPAARVSLKQFEAQVLMALPRSDQGAPLH